jgi:hypothetical protein
VLFLGVTEMLIRLGSINVESKSLDRVFDLVLPIFHFCKNDLSDNALVIGYMKRFVAAMEKDNLLQDSLESKEENEHKEERINHPLIPSTFTFKSIIATDILVDEHLSENAFVIDNHLQESRDENEEHEGKVDKERYVTNTIFNDASLFSDDSYYAQTADNCSEEDLCLDTIFGSANIDELEIEPCYKSFDANMQGPEWYTTNNTFVDDASFSEWYDNSRSDELASKGDGLEEEDTLSFSLLQNITMKCSPTMVTKVNF